MKKSFLRRPSTRILLALIVLLLVLQLVPVDRTNPPVESEVTAPLEARAVLRRACYDCHSHETVWPWYSRVAPVSWLVANDVAEARGEMNFSTWGRLPAEERAERIGEIWEEVEEGEMPLWYYLPLHPEARLSAADRDALRRWAAAAGDGGHGGEEDDD